MTSWNKLRYILKSNEMEKEKRDYHPDYISLLHVCIVCTPFHNLIKELSFSLSLSIFNSDNFFYIHKLTHHIHYTYIRKRYFVIAQLPLHFVYSFNYFTYRFVCMYIILMFLLLQFFVCGIFYNKNNIMVLRAPNGFALYRVQLLYARVSSLICYIPSSENKNYRKNEVQCTLHTVHTKRETHLHKHGNCNGNIFYSIQFFKHIFLLRCTIKPSLPTLNTSDTICVV